MLSSSAQVSFSLILQKLGYWNKVNFRIQKWDNQIDIENNTVYMSIQDKSNYECYTYDLSKN